MGLWANSYMVQGDNPLEVTTESEVEEDVDMPYNELASFCQQLLEKYELLKKDNKKMKNKFDCMLKEKDSFCLNGKNIEANAKAIHALKSILNDEYLSRVLTLIRLL